MPFWKSKPTEKDTDALVQRMVQEWQIDPDAARAYAVGQGAYLRPKDVSKPEEQRQYRRSITWAAADES